MKPLSRTTSRGECPNRLKAISYQLISDDELRAAVYALQQTIEEFC